MSALARRRSPAWEYATFTISRTASRADYRKALVDAAETGQWELQRVLVFRDGTRRVTLRRRRVPVIATISA